MLPIPQAKKVGFFRKKSYLMNGSSYSGGLELIGSVMEQTIAKKRKKVEISLLLLYIKMNRLKTKIKKTSNSTIFVQFDVK